MSDVKPEIVELAKTLEGKLEVGDNGVITAPKGTFEETLPEGLTMDQVNDVYKHIGLVSPAFVKAFGDKSQAAMESDKKLEQTTGKLDIGRWANVEGTYKRTEERRKSPADPTMITVHGATSVKINTKVRTGADMKRVRNGLIEQAKAKFGK